MSKSTKFNLSWYRELLEITNSSKKKGKELFQDTAFLELLSCESSVETQIFDDQKTEYFDLIQKYLGEKITPSEFRNKFIDMTTNNMEKTNKILQNFEELSTFWIEPGLNEFSSLFSEIYHACLSVVELGTGDDGILEDKFRNFIQKIFSQMETEAWAVCSERSK